MDRSDTEPVKTLPAAIPELQRILHGAQELNRTSQERIRAVFAEAGGSDSPQPDPVVGAAPGQSSAAEADLARTLAEKIAHTGVAFVFGMELCALWPAGTETDARWRPAKIYEFAGRHGWDAYVMNDGHMAMFRPAGAGKKGASRD